MSARRAAGHRCRPGHPAGRGHRRRLLDRGGHRGAAAQPAVRGLVRPRRHAGDLLRDRHGRVLPRPPHPRHALVAPALHGLHARSSASTGSPGCVLAGMLAVVGVAVAGPFGLVMAITPFIGVGIALLGQHDLAEPGPEAPWSELTRNLGWLLMGTVSIALVVQGGTVAVQILAGPDQQGAAGPVPQRPADRPGAAVPVPGGAGVAAAQAVAPGQRRALRRVPPRSASAGAGHPRPRGGRRRSEPPCSGRP